MSHEKLHDPVKMRARLRVTRETATGSNGEQICTTVISKKIGAQLDRALR